MVSLQRLTEKMTVSRASGIVMLALLMVSASPATESVKSDELAPSFERAQALRPTDSKAAAAMLDQLARAGDIRAQMLLGAMLIEGSQVPQNRSLGLAFLQVAAARADWMFDGNTGDEIQALARRYQLAMSGRELLEADRLAGGITVDIDRNTLAELRPALLRYTDEPAVRALPNIAFASETVQIADVKPVADGQLVGLGCAGGRGPGCVGAPPLGTPGQCAGRLLASDTPAKSRGEGARIPPPVYPVDLRRAGKEGSVRLLAHIDSSGWVCTAIVSRGAADARLDAAALESVRQWKFVPATKAGEPVEALTSFQVTFRMQR